jgi:hypothetical protein
MKTSFRLAVQKAREEAGLIPKSSGTDSSAIVSNAPARQMEECAELMVHKYASELCVLIFPSRPLKVLPDEAAADLCATFQHVAFTHLEDRIKRALDYIESNKIPITALVGTETFVYTYIWYNVQ